MTDSPTFKILINDNGEPWSQNGSEHRQAIGVVFINHTYEQALYNSTEMVQWLAKAVEAAGEEYPSYQLFLNAGKYFLVGEPYDTEEFWFTANPVASIKYNQNKEDYEVKLWTGVKA